MSNTTESFPLAMLGRAMNRRILLKAASGAGAAALAGVTFPTRMLAQTPAEVPPKTLSGTVVLSVAGEPQSFQPDYQADDYLWPIACNLYNSLFSLDNAFNVIPELATGYEVAEDGLSITVMLNPLATWHDGNPVTAADVKYTFETLVNDASAYGGGLVRAISTVDVVDDHTAVLNLSQPSASVIGFLSWYGVFVLPAHIYEGTDWSTNPANMQPIGSGPFKFVSYETAATVELAANETFFGEGPYLERLIYRIIPDSNTEVQELLNGGLDLANLPNVQVPVFEANPEFKVASKIYPSPLYMGFNLKHAPLDNVDVRRAMAMAINRDQIVETALAGYGSPENRYYPSVIEWASNPDATAPDYDPEGAKALLDTAGFPVSGDNRFALEFSIFTGWPELSDTAIVLKEQWAAIGIDVEIIQLEIASWEDEMIAGNFQMGMLGGFQGPDPANLNQRWGTGGQNWWGFENEEFVQLLADGDKALTQEERIPIYFRAQEILAENVPGVLLALQTSYTAFSTRLSGIWLDADDPAASQVGMNRFNLTKVEG